MLLIGRTTQLCQSLLLRLLAQYEWRWHLRVSARPLLYGENEHRLITWILRSMPGTSGDMDEIAGAYVILFVSHQLHTTARQIVLHGVAVYVIFAPSRPRGRFQHENVERPDIESQLGRDDWVERSPSKARTAKLAPFVCRQVYSLFLAPPLDFQIKPTTAAFAWLLSIKGISCSNGFNTSS